VLSTRTGLVRAAKCRTAVQENETVTGRIIDVQPFAPEARRQLLWSLLGDLPDIGRPISVELICTSERELYIQETLLLDLNGIEPVPAYFVRPKQHSTPTAAILYHHAHAGDYARGKDEFTRGRTQLQNPPWAEVIAANGWVGLCIDNWNFGARSGRTESELFKAMLWRGQVLWGMMVYDAIRSLDYLVSRPEVDATRVATMGLSMGSTMAWWLAALDERVRVCVDLCCLTDFDTLVEEHNLDRHGLYYYVPGLLKHFTTSTINELIAPRAHLSLAGKHDPLTPVRGLQRIDAHLRRVYDATRAEGAWRLSIHDTGHQETEEMRAEAVEWMQDWLK
jgi:hypothetical protein